MRFFLGATAFVAGSLFAAALAVDGRIRKDPLFEKVRDAAKNWREILMGPQSLARNLNMHDPELMFTADVALPSSFRVAFRTDSTRPNTLVGGAVERRPSWPAGKGFAINAVQNENDRHLQQEMVLLCFAATEETVFCYADDLPGAGLVTIFVCPLGAREIFDCPSCLIFVEDDPNSITNSTPVCTNCAICNEADVADISFNCSNVSGGDDPCAVQSCSGNCTGGSSGDNPCFPQDDGSFDCVVNDIPNDDFVLVFTGCNLTTATSIFDCPSCDLVEADSYSNITNTSARCTSCSVCPVEKNVAFDCSNFDVVDPCAVQSCNSTCLGAPATPAPVTSVPLPPSTSPPPVPETSVPVPPPAPNLCYPQGDGLFDCVIEDAPREDWTLVFTGCDLSTATSIFDCLGCEIADSESYDAITDTTNLCNICRICPVESSIAFDCSNVDMSDPCATRGCNGTCLNVLASAFMPATSTSSNQGSAAAPVLPPMAGTSQLLASSPSSDGFVRDLYLFALVCGILMVLFVW